MTEFQTLGAIWPASVTPGSSFGASEAIIRGSADHCPLSSFPRGSGIRAGLSGLVAFRDLFACRTSWILGHDGRVVTETPSRGSIECLSKKASIGRVPEALAGSSESSASFRVELRRKSPTPRVVGCGGR